jgi:cysteine desulfurase
MDKRLIYMDYSASTPVDPRVLDVMLPYFSEIYGNPAGVHHFARASEKGVEDAREQVARALNCKTKEIIFTSCGSESDNLALRGFVYNRVQRGERPHLITSPLEHSAIGRTVAQLGSLFDCDVTYLKPEKDGSLRPEDLEAALHKNPNALVTLMYANNEIGTILPLRELAEIVHAHGALLHTDAVQATGQLSVDVEALGVDMLSLSAHKFYGPKGVGALYLRDGTDLMPSQTGGSHEEGRRAGTLNVPLIVGLGKAIELAYTERESRVAHLTRLRDKLIDSVLAQVPHIELTGARDPRLPSHASFVLQHLDGNQLLMFLDNKGVGASSGSACKTGNPKPSELLMALGYDETWALGGLRLSLGVHTTEEEVDFVIETLPGLVETARLFSTMST